MPRISPRVHAAKGVSVQDLGVGLAATCIAVSLCYAGMIFTLSRRPLRRTPRTYQQPFVVFMLACLDEERVLGESLRRLMNLRGDDFAVLVIDDASEDRTAAIVEEAMAGPSTRPARGARAVPRQLMLHRRTLPNARRGKGAALNDGLRHLRASGVIDGRRPEDVVVCVVDADGRLDENVLREVAPYFADPSVGAVQIGVRMYNRDVSLLARMQDIEFVTYTDMFQVGRRRIGSVGLGGNGQFMRLAALDTLPDEPWSDCLTEDLDLGVRLIAAGWVNEFCATAAVSQQAVVSPKRLVRQRSRWFQGHMQAARLCPLVLREIRRPRAAADLLYHLTSTPLILLTSLMPIAFLLGVVGTAVASFADGRSYFPVWFLPGIYVLSFGIAHIYAYVYRQRERSLGRLRSLLLGHAFVVYGYLWFFAAWWAVGRAARGQNGWLKTART